MLVHSLSFVVSFLSKFRQQDAYVYTKVDIIEVLWTSRGFGATDPSMLL